MAEQETPEASVSQADYGNLKKDYEAIVREGALQLLFEVDTKNIMRLAANTTITDRRQLISATKAYHRYKKFGQEEHKDTLSYFFALSRSVGGESRWLGAQVATGIIAPTVMAMVRGLDKQMKKLGSRFYKSNGSKEGEPEQEAE